MKRNTPHWLITGWILLLGLISTGISISQNIPDTLEQRLVFMSGEERFDVLEKLFEKFSVSTPERAIEYGRMMLAIALDIENKHFEFSLAKIKSTLPKEIVDRYENIAKQISESRTIKESQADFYK